MTKQELKGKTVSDLVENYDLKVKLGASSGSGFVFCGRLKDIDVKAIDDDICNTYKTTISNAKRTINTLTQKPKKYSDYEKELETRYRRERGKLIKSGEEFNEYALKIEYTPTEDGYTKWLSDIEHRLDTAKTTKRRTSMRLAKFTTIGGRIIEDAYMSIDEFNTVIVIYKGSACGRAWTTKEYETGVIDYGI